MRQRGALVVCYAVAVHALLATALARPGAINRAIERATKPGVVSIADDPIIERMRVVHAAMDASVPAGAALFLGDSITMSLATSAVAQVSVNYGIGWQRSDQLLESMRAYESMSRASVVVITIGTNDILQGRLAGLRERYGKILDAVPTGPVIVLSSPPRIGALDFYGHNVRPEDADRARSDAETACAASPRCTFVDAVSATRSVPDALQADNIHLTASGYAAWIGALKAARPLSPARL